MRVTTSGEPPAADGMTKRIGFSGYVCAWVVGMNNISAHTLKKSGPIATHRDALAWARSAFREAGPDLDRVGLLAVGHRVVHGGDRFSDPVIVTEDVMTAIEELEPLAPLHNPAHLEGIRVAIETFPGVPQVVVFDTAFHHAMPALSPAEGGGGSMSRPMTPLPEVFTGAPSSKDPSGINRV